MYLVRSPVVLEAPPPDNAVPGDVLVWIVPPHPPLELGHSAGFVAAVLTIAAIPECRILRDQVFGLLESRNPSFESRHESANFHVGSPVRQQLRLRVAGE